MVLTEALQLMFDAKLVDSEAYEDTYFKSGENNTNSTDMQSMSLKRVQIFLVVEDFTKEGLEEEDVLVSEKSIYEKQLKRAIRFVKNLWGTQAEKIQLNDGAKLLSSYLNSEDGVYKTDAIEIF